MKTLIKILKGFVIGIANVIPGVSGGTLAVSLGIYDSLIHSISNFFKHPIYHFKVLFPLFIGIGLGIVFAAFTIQYLYENYPLATAIFFVGLIAGSLPLLTKEVQGRPWHLKEYGIASLFFSIVVILPFLSPASVQGTLTPSISLFLLLIVLGAIASATMVVPGVSGSMILLILGFYHPIMDTISSSLSSLLGGDFSGFLSTLLILIPFGIGVLIGIIGIAKAIEFLLTKKRFFVFVAIMGLVLASPLVIIYRLDLISFPTIWELFASIISLSFGFLIAYGFTKIPE